MESITYKAPAAMRIGHIHLKVADLDRSIHFYKDIMGFDLLFRHAGAAFLSAGGYHHHIGLNTWHSEGQSPAAKEHPGLYHFALNYPTKCELARVVKRLRDMDYTITGAADHTTHLAIYLRDPDGNGIELAWDRDPSYWTFLTSGNVDVEKLRKSNRFLDVAALIEEAEPEVQ
jgi:catechol 2,3-dioxygenase